MQRKQFTFYASFYTTIRRIPGKTARADAYDAICDFALNGVSPDLDKLSAAAAMAFVAIQPNLEASRRKAASGSLGGSGKRTASNANAKRTESNANAKQTESKDKDKNKDKSKDKDKIENKNKCSLYPPRSGGARAGKKPPVPYCSGRTAPLDEIEREALEAMLKEGGLRNA